MRDDRLDLDVPAVGRDEEEFVLVAHDRLGDVGIGGEQVRGEGPGGRLGQGLAVLVLGDEIDRGLEPGECGLGEFLLGARGRLGVGGGDLLFEGGARVIVEGEESYQNGDHRPEAGGDTLGQSAGRRRHIVLEARLRQLLGRLGPLDLELKSRAVLLAEPELTPRLHQHVVFGGYAIDRDVALAEQFGVVVAGRHAPELEMLPADGGEFRRIDHLRRLAVASEEDRLDAVVEALLLAFQRAFEMRDGDGHRRTR